MNVATIAPNWMIAVNAVTAGSSTVQAEQALGDGEVPGAGHRQELGEPLDDAEDDGVEVGERRGHVRRAYRCRTTLTQPIP